MSEIVNFNFRKITVFSFAVVAFCFFSEVSFAQEDMRKVDSENLKSTDKPSQEGGVIATEQSTPNPAGNKIITTAPKVTPVKKEQVLIGEGKKPEATPSTLNFNIFLYIVDKFKAD